LEDREEAIGHAFAIRRELFINHALALSWEPGREFVPGRVFL
jgi:hypothetical protein